MSEPLGPWIDRLTASAPAALRGRVAALTASLRDRTDLASALAQVGRETVEQVIASAGDRREALNLLAADGLVTLSLLAQAQADPAGLAHWSATLLRPVTEDV